MKVSIIIPVFNGEKYIDECLESCLNQTYENIEIVCIDDGSTDETKTHIEKFIERYKNIVLIEQQNRGVAVARNAGIERATGEYLMFVDADDYIAKDMVEIMVNKMIESQADSVKCNIKTDLAFLQHTHIDEEHFYEKEEYEQLIYRYLLDDSSVFCSSCNGMYKRELCPSFPEGLRLGEDVIFNFKYYLKSKNVLFIEPELYYYRNNGESITHNQDLDTILNNLDHYYSYDFVEKILQETNSPYEPSKFLNKSTIINYATYVRLTFQVYTVAKKRDSLYIAKRYYNLHKDIFSNISKKAFIDFLRDYYRWSNFKIRTCAIPLYKKHYNLSYIGYKYIYKNLKKFFKI